jgi:hypothetical protein
MRLIILRIALALAAGPLIAAQSHDPATASAVAAATKYVERYMQEFSAIVCEEQQVQTMVRPDGRVAKTRRLVSDLAFIRIRADSRRHRVYRDVRSVDGKPVRNRDDRLKKLFLEGSRTAIDQARAIDEESNRYNLGVNRVGVSPSLPLRVLDADRVARFTFSLSGRTLTFDERLSPADPGFTEGGRRGNLTQHGSFVVDPETGAIEIATLMGKTADGRRGLSLVVRYVEDPKLKLHVPSPKEERYLNPDRPKDDHLEATSTFSSCRRFQVIVDEKIK